MLIVRIARLADCLTRSFQRVKHDSVLPPKIAFLIAAAAIRGQPWVTQVSSQIFISQTIYLSWANWEWSRRTKFTANASNLSFISRHRQNRDKSHCCCCECGRYVYSEQIVLLHKRTAWQKLKVLADLVSWVIPHLIAASAYSIDWSVKFLINNSHNCL